MNAILRSKSHPDYGSIAVGFPIPDEHYDPLMETLRQLGMGGTTDKDCTVERIDGGLPILKRLEGQSVNVDELDCLVRQTQQFSQRDAARYQAMAFTHGFCRMDDLLNLSPAVNFQKMTVIRDFASLENDGLAHYKTLHPFASAKELEGIDGVEAAMYLILNDRGGRITPYGVAYDFNQELKQIYDPGGPLPPLNDHEGVMELSVFSPEHGRDHPISFIRLPTSEPRLERLLERGGISPRSDLSIGVACIGCDLRQLPEDFDHTSPQDFNRLAKRIAALSPEDNKKLVAVKEFAKAKEAPQIIALAENLGLFHFEPGVKSSREFTRRAQQRYQGNETVKGIGCAVEGGYVGYYGPQPLSELLDGGCDPKISMQMGGMFS